MRGILSAVTVYSEGLLFSRHHFVGFDRENMCREFFMYFFTTYILGRGSFTAK